jgi:hypothetical protein
MAKDKDKEAGVYRIVDVIGVSTVSWEDAAKPIKTRIVSHQGASVGCTQTGRQHASPALFLDVSRPAYNRWVAARPINGTVER